MRAIRVYRKVQHNISVQSTHIEIRAPPPYSSSVQHCVPLPPAPSYFPTHCHPLRPSRSSKWPSYYVIPIEPQSDPLRPYTEEIPESPNFAGEGSERKVTYPPWPSYYAQPVRPSGGYRYMSGWPRRRRLAEPKSEDPRYSDDEDAKWDTSVFRRTYDGPPEWHRNLTEEPKRDSSLKRRKSSLRSDLADLPFDALNPGPRPTTWRHDYQPPHSGKSRRFLGGRGYYPHTFSKFVPSGAAKYTLNPLLKYSRSIHPINYDLRRDPQSTYVQFLNLPRYTNPIDFYQLAADPPAHELCLYHPKLPWTITVRASESNGITIGDMFNQIYMDLSTRVSRQDFYNTSLSPSDREEITTAYTYRTRSQGKNTDEGLLRMDFLGFDVVLLGFAKGKHGLLEIKTRAAETL
ncbi:hypothetical protein H0H87_008677 [Tephrocybe sp. NHM501043]|nr:hypothetical protein H0H87_008677 [Tephrocybe sp. NHM501043]